MCIRTKDSNTVKKQARRACFFAYTHYIILLAYSVYFHIRLHRI